MLPFLLAICCGTDLWSVGERSAFVLYAELMPNYANTEISVQSPPSNLELTELPDAGQS